MKSISNTAARRIVIYITKIWTWMKRHRMIMIIIHSCCILRGSFSLLYDLSFSSQRMNWVTPLSNDHLRMWSWSASEESSQDPFIIRDAPLESSRNCPAHCQLATLHSSECNFSTMRMMLIPKISGISALSHSFIFMAFLACLFYL